jgi:bifunctional non-homologous end joining protein LigD
MADRIRAGKYTVELSNTDKVLFPGDGITKGDLIDYYRQIAVVMLPYIKDRPLVMHRFPDGIDAEGFYQQEVSDYFPDWIERVSVKKEGGSISHVVCRNAATLVYLANQACITLHVWLSRQDRLDNPDQLIFDLDPPDKDFEPVREAAQLLRQFLQGLSLESLVKTTGSRGLHVIVPLDRSAGFDRVRSFARGVAETLSRLEPRKVTSELSKEKRKGRIFLDYIRNSYGQTAVAPYAVRARPGAPVATPLDWDELTELHLNAQSYTIKNMLQRLSRRQDPWQGMWRRVYSLDKAEKKLEELKPTG